MMNLIKKSIIMIVLIGFLFSLSIILSAKEKNKEIFKFANCKIVQTNSKTIKVTYKGKSTKYKFNMEIYKIFPNPSLPIAFVFTYDKLKEDEDYKKYKYHVSPEYLACRSFVIDIPNKKKYEHEKSCIDAINLWSPNGDYVLNGFKGHIIRSINLIKSIKGEGVPEIKITIGDRQDCGGIIDAYSWNWITNDVIYFTGGACGSNLSYLFYIKTKKTEIYCQKNQRPGYGCNFAPYSKLVKKLKNLTEKYNYSAICNSISKRHFKFTQEYRKSKNEKEKKIIINKVRNFLFDVMLKKIMPPWIGTPWSFSGKSKIPGDGSIACGYFVVHILKDLGFKMSEKMARQPSENIIKNLIRTRNIKRFWNSASMDKVKKWIVESEEGIYIVGLDIHVGFIINKGNKITFIHSNYYDPPSKVVNQDLMEKSPLTNSKYRILGKILDDTMIEKWLTGRAFTMKYDYFKK